MIKVENMKLYLYNIYIIYNYKKDMKLKVQTM